MLRVSSAWQQMWWLTCLSVKVVEVGVAVYNCLCMAALERHMQDSAACNATSLQIAQRSPNFCSCISAFCSDGAASDRFSASSEARCVPVRVLALCLSYRLVKANMRVDCS